MTGAAYLFLSLGAITIYGLAEKAERLRAERDAALRALTRERGGRLGEAESPCPDELALEQQS